MTQPVHMTSLSQTDHAPSVIFYHSLDRTCYGQWVFIKLQVSSFTHSEIIWDQRFKRNLMKTKILIMPSSGQICYLLASICHSQSVYWICEVSNPGTETIQNYKCGPVPNVMAALPNIGCALCWTPQFGWRPLLECHAVTLPRRETRWNYLGCPKLTNDLSR